MEQMIRKKDEIMAALQEVLGSDTSEAAISLVEDVTDTLNDYDIKTSDTTNWKTKYEENDANWAKRYRDRFFSKDEGDNEPDVPDAPEKALTYENLFTEVN